MTVRGLVAAIITGSYDYHNSIFPSLLDGLAQRVEFVGFIHRAAQRKVDYTNVVTRLQRDRLVNGSDHLAIGARAVLVEHSQIDDACAGGNSFESLAVRKAR